MMADDTDDSGGVILEGPFDPDAQATVTDFIDYTEYLPSDLIRSLTLIRGLDETYLDAAQKIHELTKIYGQLPDLPVESRPNPQQLREQVSIQLDRAINAREASYAEACRAYDVVDRHHDRLGNIKKKLESLPKPPSRDPTPPPAAVSPESKRARSGRKTEDVNTRITLRVDGRGPSRHGLPKSRSRRSLVATFDPDSPIASTEQSDNEATPKDLARRRRLVDKDQGSPVHRKHKQAKPARAPRPAGMGTNAHSAVAGISTSNALALLKPPPEDAQLGSEDLPWLRLTEWEMTRLRKKMKKNAVWQPSEIMINRELARSGRGWEGYRAAKAQAEANGEEFIDCDDIMDNYMPGKLTRKSEAEADPSVLEETKTSNRGMKLNEAKKLKRETLAREQAATAAAEAEMAARRLGDIGSTFKSLFSTPGETSHGVPNRLGSSPRPNGMSTREKEKSKTPRKRKLEETPAVEAASSPPAVDTSSQTDASKPTAKKRKLSKAASEATRSTIEPPPGSSSASAAAVTPPANETITRSKILVMPSSSPPRTTRARSTASRSSIPPTTTAVPSGGTRKRSRTATPPATRPLSRRRSAAWSVEPSMAAGAGSSREHLRRHSTTPAAKTPVPEPARASSTAPLGGARRRKRPAPGPVSSGQDGGAAVSYGRRKSKPTKRRAPGKDGAGLKGDDYRIDEDGVLEEIDANEPRYCLCGDVSFGTMICCENPDVSSVPALLRWTILANGHCFSVIENGSISTALISPRSPAGQRDGIVPNAASSSGRDPMALKRLVPDGDHGSCSRMVSILDTPHESCV